MGFRGSEEVRLVGVGVGVIPIQGQKLEDEEWQMQDDRHLLVDGVTGAVAYGLWRGASRQETRRKHDEQVYQAAKSLN